MLGMLTYMDVRAVYMRDSAIGDDRPRDRRASTIFGSWSPIGAMTS